MILAEEKFWNYALDRVVKSFAQGILSGPPLGVVFDLDWRLVLGSALSYSLLSFMTAIVAYKGTGGERPSPEPDSESAPETLTGENPPEFPPAIEAEAPSPQPAIGRATVRAPI